MNVAVNTRVLIKDKLEGIGKYKFEILRRLVLLRPGDTFFFIFDHPPHPEFLFAPNVVPVNAFLPSKSPLLLDIYFDLVIPRILRKIKADVFFSPDGYLSLRTNVPSIPVIHDINFVHHPEFLPPKWRKYYNSHFPKFAYKAAHIITVSDFCKQDISQTLQIPNEKISVAENSISDDFKTIAGVDKEMIKSRYTGGKDYFVFVGAMHTRKNPLGMFRAFEGFKSKSKSDFKLLIVGEKKWTDPEAEKFFASMAHQKDIIFTGRVSEEEKVHLLRSAFAMLFISKFEGFGVPILEAFAAGIPVIAARNSAMPEVGGDACFYADADDSEKVADIMIQLHLQPELRLSHIEKGKQQLKLFNWDQSTSIISEVITKVAEQHAKE